MSAVDFGLFAERLAAARDTASRWRLLREFQREWGYREPSGAPVRRRDQEDPHRAAMRELFEEDERRDAPPPVPRALAEWWELPFNSFTHTPTLYYTHPVWPPEAWPDPSGGNDGLPEGHPLVPPGGDRRVCVFKGEYQWCNAWGYLAAEAGLDDPRVLGHTEDGWIEQSRSISEFFLHLAVERLPLVLGWTLYCTVDDPGLGERVAAAYPEMGLLPWHELETERVAYGAPDAIVYRDRVEMPEFDVIVAGRTREAVAAVARTLGLDGSGIRPPSADYEQWGEPPAASFRAGDGDPGGRWRVREVRPPAAAEPSPYEPAEHSAPVTAVAHVEREDGGAVVVSGDADGGVLLYAPGHPAPPPDEPFRIGRGGVTALAIAVLDGGPAVAIAGSGGQTILWDLRSQITTDLKLGAGITGLALEGTDLLVTTADAVAVLELDPSRVWPRRELMGRILDADWSDAPSLGSALEGAASAEDGVARNETNGLFNTLTLSGAPGEGPTAAAVPFVVELARDTTHPHRARLVELLGRVARGPHAAARTAVAADVPAELLDDADAAVRAMTAYLLAAFPDREDLGRTLAARAAAETDPRAAASAALALAEFAATEPLARLARAEAREVRVAAMIGLLRTGGPRPAGDALREIEDEIEADESALDGLPWWSHLGRARALARELDEPGSR
ncbi:hypothetical protein [Spirillospora sp. NPDC029432]|uniref:hypothetical protein n=1 Tax=Spirillospora sp. NPDC029432 TaxID=3154599 RepID=UPI0034551E6E